MSKRVDEAILVLRARRNELMHAREKVIADIAHEQANLQVYQDKVDKLSGDLHALGERLNELNKALAFYSE